MSLPGNNHTTVGCLYIAVVVGSALYGVGCLQAWLYFRKFSKRDNWWIKGCVIFVTVCDTVQMALISAAVYIYLVTNNGQPEHLKVLEPTLLVELLFSAGISVAVQMFYAYRIYILSNKKWYLAALVVFLAWASIIAGLVFLSKVLQYRYVNDLLLQTTLSMTSSGLSALCDIVITILLVFYLERSKTGLRKSTDMINRLILFAFSTGMPTTACATLSFSLMKGEPNSYMYILFYLIMGRFFTNSLLINLNGRAYIAGDSMGLGRTDLESNGISLNTVRFQVNHPDDSMFHFHTRRSIYCNLPIHPSIMPNRRRQQDDSKGASRDSDYSPGPEAKMV
ncbi:hypothetical protein CYLTODRAFT_454018 [Cylindrobasidium torrendii FP15055 ss-10]|uniref:DUF6534 domain-containing protein n=1 Tax=Cylindrobasidium torrendii FP15055 ss-10 TaxID=1314674 RepID=A0A0D7BCI8_9AGAR|nr:hypothetical protein CYLTODRAFT_454018 [Cylindrobasidium torrendii FP15055 ss-10]